MHDRGMQRTDFDERRGFVTVNTICLLRQRHPSTMFDGPPSDHESDEEEVPSVEVEVRMLTKKHHCPLSSVAQIRPDLHGY